MKNVQASFQEKKENLPLKLYSTPTLVNTTSSSLKTKFKVDIGITDHVYIYTLFTVFIQYKDDSIQHDSFLHDGDWWKLESKINAV